MFDSLWPLTEGRRVHKRRYPIVEDGSTWEIDQFTDRNLVITEMDPDEPGYRNYNLAR